MQADYVAAMTALFGEVEIGQLVELHEAGVEPDYAGAMMSVFGRLEMAQLVDLHEAGVEPEFAAVLRAEFPDLEAVAIIEAAEEGVEADDIEFFVARRARGSAHEATTTDRTSTRTTTMRARPGREPAPDEGPRRRRRTGRDAVVVPVQRGDYRRRVWPWLDGKALTRST